MPSSNLSPAKDVEDDGLPTGAPQGSHPKFFFLSLAHLTAATRSVSSIHLSLSKRSSARATLTGGQRSSDGGEYEVADADWPARSTDQ
jgi:hypothetical protein